MAKLECTDFDRHLAEAALHIAEHPDVNTAEDIAAYMKKELGQDISPLLIVRAVQQYTQQSQKEQQSSGAAKLSGIKKLLARLGIKDQAIDLIIKENAAGTYTETNERTERVLSQTEKTLDEILSELNKIKVSNIKTKKLKEIVELLDSGGDIVKALKHPRVKTDIEQLASTKADIAKQQKRYNDTLKKLKTLELPIKPDKTIFLRKEIKILNSDIRARQLDIERTKQDIKIERTRLRRMEHNNALYEKLKALSEGKKIHKNTKVKEQDDIRDQLRSSINDIEQINKIKGDIESAIEQLSTGQFREKPSKATREKSVERLALERKRKILNAKIKNSMSEKQDHMGLKVFKEVNGTLRTLGASGDLPLGRQGGVPLMSHPILATRATIKALRYSWTESDANKVEAEWAQEPDYDEMVSLKIIKESEEGFEDMDFLNKLLGKKYNPYRISARQQHILLTDIRINMYKQLTWSLPVDRTATQEDKKMIAEFVLISTGVGQSKTLDQIAMPLAQVFFAPKYTLSRMQYFTAYPLIKQGLRAGETGDTELLKMFGKEYFRTISGWACLLAASMLASGADWKDVEKDPASSDFLTIRQGHTRVDLTFGLRQIIVPIAQIVSSRKVNPQTGKGRDISKDKTGVGTSWARKRLAPVVGMSVTEFLADGKNVIGNDVSPWRNGDFNPEGLKNLAWSTVPPYSLSSMIDIWQDAESTTRFKLFATVMNALSFGGNMFDAPGEPKLPSNGNGSHSNSSKSNTF